MGITEYFNKRRSAHLKSEEDKLKKMERVQEAKLKVVSKEAKSQASIQQHKKRIEALKANRKKLWRIAHPTLAKATDAQNKALEAGYAKSKVVARKSANALARELAKQARKQFVKKHHKKRKVRKKAPVRRRKRRKKSVTLTFS